MSKIDVYYQAMIDYCKEREGGREFDYRDAIELWRILYWMRQVINPACDRDKSDFRTRLCRQCRSAGRNIEACGFNAELDELITDALYNRA